MPFYQRSLLRTIFRTSHKLLLDSLLKPKLECLKGDALVLGAGYEPYRELLKNTNSVYLSDVESFHSGIDGAIDAHSIEFPDSHFHSVVAVEVFEHLKDPSKAASEVYRVLKVNGVALISVPFMFRIHGDPYDYNRFTRQGLEVLFSQFKSVKIVPFGSRIHVISDIISTASKVLVLLRVFNHLLSLPGLNSSSVDCPSGYVVILFK